MSHRKTHLLSSCAVLLTRCKRGRRVVRMPEHGSEVWQFIVIEQFLKRLQVWWLPVPAAPLSCSTWASACVYPEFPSSSPLPPPSPKQPAQSPSFPHKSPVSCFHCTLSSVASRPSPSCLSSPFKLRRWGGGSGCSGLVLSHAPERGHLLLITCCPRAREQFPRPYGLSFLARTAVWATAECGILRGRCSLDSGGGSFRWSPGRRGNLQRAAQTVMPWPRERGAGSDPLRGTWALQSVTAIPTHTCVFAWPPSARATRKTTGDPVCSLINLGFLMYFDSHSVSL